MTNALPARKDSRVRETVLSPVAPQSFPGQTNLIDFGFDGFPDPYHSSPALELLKSATFFIDAANAKDGDAYAFNQGTGGFALDARYGSSLAIGAADTNDPLLLPWSGETYVYLPGSASNTIACTAPVGTASFAAYPTGGGSATTGAAVAGAFTLQTTGSWIRVDILDAGPTVIASFVAANSTSTGYTDAFSVVWTINRSTAGRKSVAVTRPVWLFGTDDYIDTVNNALLRFGAGQDFTVLSIHRIWATGVGLGLLGFRPTVGSNVGFSYGITGTTFRMSAFSAGGVILDDTTAGNATYGSLQMGSVSRSAGSLSYGINTTLETQSPVGAALSLDDGVAVPRIGAHSGSVNFSDMELLAVAVFRRALTATEIASINTYYGTA